MGKLGNLTLIKIYFATFDLGLKHTDHASNNKIAKHQNQLPPKIFDEYAS